MLILLHPCWCTHRIIKSNFVMGAKLPSSLASSLLHIRPASHTSTYSLLLIAETTPAQLTAIMLVPCVTQSFILVLCASLFQTSCGLSTNTHGIINRRSCCYGASTMLAPLPKRRICRLGLRLCSTNDDNQNDAISQDNSQDSRIELSDSIATTNSTGQPTKSPFGFLRNLKSVNKQSISKLGMSALLAYGFVSNVSGVLAVSSAWFIFSKRVSLSSFGSSFEFVY